MRNIRKNLIPLGITVSLLCLVGFFPELGLAKPASSLGALALETTKSFSGVAKLISAISYVAGLFFAVSGLLKFKAHKDNPTQVSLGQPLMLLAVSTGLIFLPNVITSLGATFWGFNTPVNVDAFIN